MLDSENMISLMMKEAEAYTTFDSLEKYVQEGRDLSVLPIQPLYMTLRSRPCEEIATYLPQLGALQRKVFLDLDLWKRDDLDLENFNFWLKTYSLCPDEKIRLEFSKSSEFSLYLKSKFNIWTFDVEDPQYPDHDNYFLTDDGLLLFEFDESFEFVEEVKRIILDMYSQEGVEKAYANLFKIVSESFSTAQEEEFQSKKERLRDIGFVDYYEALVFESAFPNKDILNNFIKKKVKTKGEICDLGQNQILPKSSLVAFKEKIGPLEEELNKVRDEKRASFLQFNFLRLVNGVMELDDSLKKGSVALSRTGNKSRSMLLLGLDYLKFFMREKGFALPEGANLFDLFDFVDLYKIGNSLLKLDQLKLKKCFKGTPFDDGNESFLGNFLSENIGLSFEAPIKFREMKVGATKTKEINGWESFKDWSKIVTLISSMTPFASKFHEVYEKLRNSGTINSGYYLNYAVEDITFESILLSAYANYQLGFFEKGQDNKMGITLNEYKVFMANILDENLKLNNNKEIEESIDNFLESFALNKVSYFKEFFKYILCEELEDVDISSIEDAEFRHIGGPIILNSLDEV